MKNKLLAVLATFGMVASASAVKINNNLSINGFIDGSYYSEDNQADQTDDANIGLDEVELNFLVNAGNISGELHIDSEDDTNDTGLDIEQVHFTYSFGNGASVQVGRFGSALGLEREDPAGLYTFSRAYGSTTNFNLGNVDANVGEGARLSYATGDFSGSLALYNGIGQVEDDNGSKNDLDYELALSYTGIDNLVIGAGFSTQRPDEGNNTEVWTVNAAYTLNKLLIAGEYTNSEEGAEDVSAYMILADYDVNDKLGVAVRYSNWETDSNGDESDKLTFAPNYALTDNLGAIVEFSAEEDANGNEIDSFAVELTYTF
jgi:hypothetical protein